MFHVFSNIYDKLGGVLWVAFNICADEKQMKSCIYLNAALSFFHAINSLSFHIIIEIIQIQVYTYWLIINEDINEEIIAERSTSKKTTTISICDVKRM